MLTHRAACFAVPSVLRTSVPSVSKKHSQPNRRPLHILRFFFIPLRPYLLTSASAERGSSPHGPRLMDHSSRITSC